MVQLVHESRLRGSLVIAGTVYAELLAHPLAETGFLSHFLGEVGIAADFETGSATWDLAGRAYAAYCRRRRRSGGGIAKRLLADFVIGAHAQLHADRLATLDPERYRAYFPELVLIP